MYENRWQTHKFTSCNMTIKNHQVIKVDLEASHDILEDQLLQLAFLQNNDTWKPHQQSLGIRPGLPPLAVKMLNPHEVEEQMKPDEEATTKNCPWRRHQKNVINTCYLKKSTLVVWFNPSPKNMFVKFKLDHFPQFSRWKIKNLWNHHLVMYWLRDFLTSIVPPSPALVSDQWPIDAADAIPALAIANSKFLVEKSSTSIGTIAWHLNIYIWSVHQFNSIHMKFIKNIFGVFHIHPWRVKKFHAVVSYRIENIYHRFQSKLQKHWRRILRTSISHSLSVSPYIHIHILVFPKIGVPPNHPFQ